MSVNTNPSAEDCFNRPMAEADLIWLEQESSVTEMRAMIECYTREGLPVMNGSLRYSNFNEGPDHVFTLNPYRQWEYASLASRLMGLPERVRFLDIGGAGSLLPYYLAEKGHHGVALERESFLVAAAKYVAEKRKLPLQAVTGDAVSDMSSAGEGFGLVTMISVLEHIPPADWAAAFRHVARALRPDGWFYLTFDYGSYLDQSACDQSIQEIQPVLAALQGAGLSPVGNDPLCLPPEWLARRSSPGNVEIGRRHLLNLGRVDGATPVSSWVKHLLRRAFIQWQRPNTRFAHHNFFRLLCEKR